MANLEPCEHSAAKMQTLLNQLNYITFEMTCKPNLWSLESTSKAIFNPLEALSKKISFYGQTKASWSYRSQEPTFNKPLRVSSTFGCLLNLIFNP